MGRLGPCNSNQIADLYQLFRLPVIGLPVLYANWLVVDGGAIRLSGSEAERTMAEMGFHWCRQPARHGLAAFLRRTCHLCKSLVLSAQRRDGLQHAPLGHIDVWELHVRHSHHGCDKLSASGLEPGDHWRDLYGSEFFTFRSVLVHGSGMTIFDKFSDTQISLSANTSQL